MPGSVARAVLRDTPLLRGDQTLRDALRELVESDLPALPVVDARDRLAGIFGEREFIGAIFPGYLKEMRYAAFVPGTLDDALQKRAAAAGEPVAAHMNSEHIDVDTNVSDVGLAEIFLHHRVLVVPVIGDGKVVGVVRRTDFFRELARRMLEAG
jgi:CBS domain-containing protein